MALLLSSYKASEPSKGVRRTIEYRREKARLRGEGRERRGGLKPSFPPPPIVKNL